MSSDAPKHPVRQRADRQAVAAEVGVRRAGARTFRVSIFDLSASGCKIEFVERPAIDERVWVKFDGLEAIQGTVRWIAGHIGGVQFERALHVEVFKHLIS